MIDIPQPRPLTWIGSSRRDMKTFPQPVRRKMGLALYAAQAGETPPSAKPLKGFGGASTLELVEDHDGNTYRAVYTVRFADAVYVLHAFQKKSKRRIATPKADIEMIKRRLAEVRRQQEKRS
ncbi:MAG: type II toxin-antitoxin system RelE/ParE family toxin [Alphaproteobacteria bacterium]|nr:type II toxin-antitoxin system RelE/ParE family toxin [Alphaproteobacteria bacterium]